MVVRPYVIAHSFELLDAEFDAPDPLADQQLCRALAAGRWGLHPDAWGNHEPMVLRAQPDEPDPGVETPVDPEWEAKHRRRPVEERKPALERTTWRHRAQPPPERKPREDVVDGFGWVRLTCDDCNAEFDRRMRYPAGLRPAFVVAIRALGREEGWTCIVGRDRCPRCSDLAAPQSAVQPLDLGT